MAITSTRSGKRGAYSRKRSPLLPQALKKFIQRRLMDGLGVFLVAIAVVLAASLLTYDHLDPSYNHAVSTPPGNALGLFGSYIADILLQTLGLASFVAALTCAVWGLHILRQRPLRRWWLRTILLISVLVLTAIWLSFLPSGVFYTQGGAMGMGLRTSLTQFLAPMLGAVAAPLIGFTTAFLSLIFLIGILGFRFDEWQEAGYRAILFLRWTTKRRPRISHPPFEENEDFEPEYEEPVRKSRIEKEEDPTPVRKAIPAIKRNSSSSTKRSKEPDLLPVDEYSLPPLNLLQLTQQSRSPAVSEAALQANAELLMNVLSDFGIRGDIVRISPGPVVTLYELEPAPGTKSSRVIGLADDIARSVSAVSVRVAVVPGRNVIGIELPNAKRETVYLRELLSTEAYDHGAAKLALVLGKDISGTPIVADLARMPHLLVAGTTGSGKSVAVNTMILSLLYRLSPDQCRFIMIDPKMLELSVYDGIPHLLAPVVTEPKKAVVALKWTVREMEDRYRAMSKLGVRNIEGYNSRLREARQNGEILTRKVQTGFDPDTGKPLFEEQAIDLAELPYIVVFVDEFADLMLVAGKDIEAAIQRLAQMARAAGIHLIMATQRPSVDVITGTIKANFPTRISFQVTSKIDSRTILGESGAEQLLGQGDMLYMAAGGRITRVHGPFVRDDEVEQVVAYLKKQGAPEYIESVTEDDEEFGGDLDGGEGASASGSGDEMYDKAIALIAREGKASTSFIQRHFQIGYNKAARIIERMEKEGVVSQANHVGKREVLVRRTNED